MPQLESGLFLPESDFNVQDFLEKTVIRAIIVKFGKNPEDDLYRLHERPDWSKIAPLLYQLHGGKKLPYETPLRTLKRELRDELGMKVTHSEFLGVHEFGGWLNYCYLIPKLRARHDIKDKSGQTHKLEERAEQLLHTQYFSLAEITSSDFKGAFNHPEICVEVSRICRPRSNN